MGHLLQIAGYDENIANLQLAWIQAGTMVDHSPSQLLNECLKTIAAMVAALADEKHDQGQWSIVVLELDYYPSGGSGCEVWVENDNTQPRWLSLPISTIEELHRLGKVLAAELPQPLAYVDVVVHADGSNWVRSFELRGRRVDRMAVANHVERELAAIHDPAVLKLVRKLQVEPHSIELPWIYGPDDQTYVCWIVLEHSSSNTGIAYCEDGFGPRRPWGLVFISGPNISMGMSDNWYRSLEHAVRESKAWPGE